MECLPLSLSCMCVPLISYMSHHPHVCMHFDKVLWENSNQGSVFEITKQPHSVLWAFSRQSKQFVSIDMGNSCLFISTFFSSYFIDSLLTCLIHCCIHLWLVLYIYIIYHSVRGFSLLLSGSKGHEVQYKQCHFVMNWCAWCLFVCSLCCPNGNFSHRKYGLLSPRKASCNRITLPNPN